MSKHQKQYETPEIPEEQDFEEELVENESDQTAQIAELQAQNEKLHDQFVRAHADMENLRRRTQAELEKRSKFAISAFALDILTVSDNLDRALALIPVEKREKQPELIKNMLVGLEMTQKEIKNALEKNNIKCVESLGKVFDPNIHKVIQEIDDPAQTAGTIVQEWQKGYTIGDDRILREAVVIVTKGGPKDGTPPLETGHTIDTSA